MGIFDWFKRSTPSRAASSDPWDKAIAAADAGRRVEAVAEFRRAIVSNPKYYVSEVKPAGIAAASAWQEAAEQYSREADAKAAVDSKQPTQCASCGNDIGLRWHYDFESIEMAATVAAQCPDCGRLTCKADLKYGPDGNYPPCQECGTAVESLMDGPAYSSMVEQASRQRRYRGAIKQPSTLGREIKRG